MESAPLKNPAARPHDRRLLFLLAGAGLTFLATAAWLAWPPPPRPPLPGALESTPWGWRLRFAVNTEDLARIRRYGRARVLPAGTRRVDGRIDRLAGAWDGGPTLEVTARFLPDEPTAGPAFEPATIVLEAR